MVPVTAAATFCATLVDEWVAAGLTDAVVCPGSRSTPLALALAERGDGLRLHVVLDERSAGFVAVGLARATGRPVPVLTTSGTATTNLHPAVVEAHQDAVPLIACTADRPPELHGVGAPQTIDQQRLYGSAVRSFVDAGVPDEQASDGWRRLATDVWRAAAGTSGGSVGGAPPGPVQLNLPFREPLLGRPGPLPPARAGDAADRGSPDGPPGSLLPEVAGARVLVVLGPPAAGAGPLLDRAAALGWPVLCDPRVVGEGPTVVRRADALLRVEQFAAAAAPDVVLRFGALPASKVLARWLDSLEVPQVGLDPWARCFDPGGSLAPVTAATVDELAGWLAGAGLEPAPSDWTRGWTEAEEAAERALTAALRPLPLTEPLVARRVTEAARDRGAALVVSSSMPIRDVEWFGVRDAPAVHANRGANGIDGVVSTAVGVALGRGTTFAVVGDLAFLHDTNGLLVAHATGAELTLVVVDNGGGGIFHFLPPHDALDGERFEQLFGTPQQVDVVAVAHAHGVPARRVGDHDALVAALAESTPGPRVLVVPTDRTANVAEHERLHRAVREAVERVVGP